MMKILLFIILFVLFALGRVNAFAQTLQPAPGYTQIPIWPSGKIPDAQPNKKLESMKVVNNPLVAGKPWTEVSDVSEPTMTVYSPKNNNIGAAVIVFPG